MTQPQSSISIPTTRPTKLILVISSYHTFLHFIHILYVPSRITCFLFTACRYIILILHSCPLVRSPDYVIFKYSAYIFVRTYKYSNKHTGFLECVDCREFGHVWLVKTLLKVVMYDQ